MNYENVSIEICNGNYKANTIADKDVNSLITAIYNHVLSLSDIPANEQYDKLKVSLNNAVEQFADKFSLYYGPTWQAQKAAGLVSAMNYKAIDELPEMQSIIKEVYDASSPKRKALINLIRFINQLDDKDLICFMMRTFVTQENNARPAVDLYEWLIFSYTHKKHIMELSREQSLAIDERFMAEQ